MRGEHCVCLCVCVVCRRTASWQRSTLASASARRTQTSSWTSRCSPSAPSSPTVSSSSGDRACLSSLCPTACSQESSRWQSAQSALPTLTIRSGRLPHLPHGLSELDSLRLRNAIALLREHAWPLEHANPRCWRGGMTRAETGVWALTGVGGTCGWNMWGLQRHPDAAACVWY